MIFERKPSFDRSWKALPTERKEKAVSALNQLIGFFEGGQKPIGLGLKKLKSPFWEIRTDLKDRILFSLEQGRAAFILVGNHNDIHRALRRS